MALVLVPLLFFAALEILLRLFGFGYPTSFLLRAENNGREVWIQNDDFGWRFFGKHLARQAQAISISREKAAGTIRIFVFGESAAYGDPQPAFGLPRMLEAMLNLRFRGTRIEVVNAAMTGINSHVVRSIAKDCAKADGDIWVVYMGNNEVVGPYGAGTVFGPQVPALGLIRSSLALKTTRVGQLLDAALEQLRPLPADKNEWGGMVMFLDQQVRADEPRMARVYDHFEQNVSDIIAAGRNAGAGIVVSTVAVNLKDCAPFASKHRPGLSANDTAQWLQVYQRAVRFQEEGNLKDALVAFNEASRLDKSVAEMQFRRGWCALALGKTAEADDSFRSARDQDTLRFRCDSRMSEITRRVASRYQGHVLLADAETTFARQSRNGIPGGDLFYEHVHLTWEGNWLLARTIAEQVATLLPASVANHPSADSAWPSPEACAARLAWTDISHAQALSDIIGRLHDPPFTHQINHGDQLARLNVQLEKLTLTSRSNGIAKAVASCEAATAAFPEDAILQSELADLRQQAGDLKGAADAARRFVELMPHVSTGWHRLGSILAQSRRDKEAVSALETALRLDPENVWTLNSLALAHKKAGQTNEALREFRQAVAIKPRFGIAHLAIGQILEQQGKTQEAEGHYQKALQNRIHRSGELAALARFCAAKGWFTAAVTNFQDALDLSPADASLHLELALSLKALNRTDEGQRHLAAAARLNPSQVEALYLLGLSLGRQGKPAEAAAQFREVVRISPDLVEARLNLAFALMSQNLNNEALEQLDEVLRRSPTNAQALGYVQAIRAKAAVTGEKPASK